jgi:hypothetical protein
MSSQINQGIGQCCIPPTKGYRLLFFPDGSQAGVMGLDEFFDDAYMQGKVPDPSVAAGLVDRLSEKNYIPPGQFEEYREVVLKEYRKFYAARGQGRTK